MKTIYSILLLMLALNGWSKPPFSSQNFTFQTDSVFQIQGKVTDSETNEPIIFGSVGVYQNGILLTRSQTDFDGNYSLIFPRSFELREITVDVEVSYLGYQTQRIVGMIVQYGKANKLDFQLSKGSMEFIPIITTGCCWWPIIEQDNMTQGQILTSDQIRQRRN